MVRIEGSLARRFDFGELTPTQGCFRQAKAALRLARPSNPLSGLEKYKVLDHRRRQAQMKARRALTP